MDGVWDLCDGIGVTEAQSKKRSGSVLQRGKVLAQNARHNMIDQQVGGKDIR